MMSLVTKIGRGMFVKECNMRTYCCSGCFCDWLIDLCCCDCCERGRDYDSDCLRGDEIYSRLDDRGTRVQFGGGLCLSLS